MSLADNNPKRQSETPFWTISRRKTAWAYLFLIIPIIFFAYIRIYPTFYAFAMSLYDYNPLALEQKYVGLENYEKIAEELAKPKSETLASFRNTASYVILGVPVQLALALLIALLLNEIRFMSTFYRILFFLPFVTSTVAIAWVFRMLYQPRFGFFNVILQAFSLPQQPFIKNPQQALLSVLVFVIWQGLGFGVIIFLAGLKQISRSYYEAAEVDGATRWTAFRYITIPLLNPSIVYLLVLQTISFLRMFAPVFAMQGVAGGPLNSTGTVVLQVYREGFGSLNMGFASALTVTLFGLILGITIIQLSVTNRDTN